MTTIATHNGKFHADEIFAIATIKIATKNLVHWIRTRNEKSFDEADLIIDVGGKYDGERFFDHHQPEFNKFYSDGTRYASFGLIWEKFGQEAISNLVPINDVAKLSEIFDRVTIDFVKLIDNCDNGEGNIMVPESSIVSGMNLSSPFLTDEDRTAQFNKAISFAEEQIYCQIDHAICNIERDHIINMGLKARNQKEILVLYKGTDWTSIISTNPEVLYVVFPGMTEENMWYIQCVPPEKGNFEQKLPLPLEWKGKRNKELQEITGVEDAIFCHMGRFIGGATSKEGAKKMAKKALVQGGIQLNGLG